MAKNMYQKRAERKEKKQINDNNQEVFHKTNINWFPGHMAKTRKQITEDLKLVDIVIEILDARIPISSRNPEIDQLLQNKKKITVLNKHDLSDVEENNKWLKYFREKGEYSILLDSNTGKGIDEIIKEIKDIMKSDLNKLSYKGRIGRKIRVMVVGIPNVGKSSFINRISKRGSAEVGNRPGVTKRKQWIRVNDEIELLDTPGVLWPKFESKTVALNLAFTGAIKDEVLEISEVAYEFTKYMLMNYIDNIIERYNFDISQIRQILDQDQEENQNIYEIMQLIGRKRGAIMSGGIVDVEKTSRIILEDFRSGKFGRISIEKID